VARHRECRLVLPVSPKWWPLRAFGKSCLAFRSLRQRSCGTLPHEFGIGHFLSGDSAELYPSVAKLAELPSNFHLAANYFGISISTFRFTPLFFTYDTVST
jgi:hypothetical protein